MFSEEEYNAIQDLLELDAILGVDLQARTGELRKETIKTYLSKVRAKFPRRPSIEFPSACEWFNIGEPITQNHLHGRLTLLDFWTYCCINCMHILPDLEAVEENFAGNENVLVVGVHSAKFENERVGKNIENAIQRYEISHPVVNDAQASLWQNLSVSCWPTILLCGPDAKPLKYFVGEGHRQDMIDFVSIALDVFKDDLDAYEKKSLPNIQSGLQAKDSPLRYPGKVLVQESQMFIADTGNHRILVSNLDGKVQKVIGSGQRGFADGPLQSAKFNSPQGLALIGQSLFVCDTNNHLIRKVDLDNGIVSTIAGNGKQCINSQIQSGQDALSVSLASPWDLTVYEGNLLIAMAGSHQLWKYEFTAKVLTLMAGSGKEENRNNSYPLKASFAQPSGLCMIDDKVFVADSESSSVRVFHPKKGVQNVCGGSKNPLDLFSFGDEDGKGTNAKLQHPLGVAKGPEGKLFIADSYNHKLKVVTELDAKTPACSTCPLQGLDEPGGLSFDGVDRLYIADTNNHCIKKVDVNDYSFSIIDLEVPMVASTIDEVDSTRPIHVIQAKRGEKMIVKVELPEKFELNAEAPNSWKLDSKAKGSIGPDLKIHIAADQLEDKSSLDAKLYLCSNGLCSVHALKVLIETSSDDNSLANEFVIKL